MDAFLTLFARPPSIELRWRKSSPKCSGIEPGQLRALRKAIFYLSRPSSSFFHFCSHTQPRLADTRRSAIHCADVDMEYYRLRSFSITSHGICNLGDSMRQVERFPPSRPLIWFPILTQKKTEAEGRAPSTRWRHQTAEEIETIGEWNEVEGEAKFLGRTSHAAYCISINFMTEISFSCWTANTTEQMFLHALAELKRLNRNRCRFRLVNDFNVSQRFAPVPV